MSRKKIIYILLFVFVLALGTGVWIVYHFTYKVVNKVRSISFERNGIEIYQALFEAPTQNCVQVINHKDQTVPRLDCCIWLEFNTCPAELRRIIAQQQFTTIAFYAPGYSPKPAWFNPAALGDSIITMRHHNPDDPNRDQLLYFSKDSTHAFYCDMAD